MDLAPLNLYSSKVEIISSIEKGQTFGGDIWQSTDDIKNIHHIVQTTPDLTTDRIIFKTNGVDALTPLRPLYVRLNYRSIIFCLQPGEFRVSGDKVTCEYPHSARALPERKGERYVLPFDSGISLSIKKTERSIKEMIFELEVRMVDVSERGFGILISASNKEYLHRFDHCWIKAINQQPISRNLLGRVCYVAPKGYYLKRGDVRLGLSLDEALNQEIFESLKKRSQLVLSA